MRQPRQQRISTMLIAGLLVLAAGIVPAAAALPGAGDDLRAPAPTTHTTNKRVLLRIGGGPDPLPGPARTNAPVRLDRVEDLFHAWDRVRERVARAGGSTSGEPRSAIALSGVAVAARAASAWQTVDEPREPAVSRASLGRWQRLSRTAAQFSLPRNQSPQPAATIDTTSSSGR